MCGQNEQVDQLLEGDSYAINFYDSEKNSVRILNDDDLKNATAVKRRVLKFFIDPTPESPLFANWNLASKTNQKSKGQGQTEGGYDWRQHVKELSEDERKQRAEQKALKKEEKLAHKGEKAQRKFGNRE